MGQRRIEEEITPETNESTNGAYIKETASRALGMIGAVPRALNQSVSLPYDHFAPEVSEQLFRELHTYPRKYLTFTRLLWAVFGLLGGHRFYLGKVGSGIGMLCSLGGLGVWWIVDGFKLRAMVASFNEEQESRENQGLPPIDMDFVPVVHPRELAGVPEWGKERKAKGKLVGELIADAIALSFFGYILGSFTQSVDYHTAALAIVVLIVTVNFVDLLIPWHHLPAVKSIIHWDYRLRLFYHFNSPGRRLALYFRPLVGLFHAPFNKKSRSEVLLYLEIGSIFFAINAMFSLAGGELWEHLSQLEFSNFFESWTRGVVLGFFGMYALAAPIGSILMKHILLQRPNFVRWVLSLLVIFFLVKGFLKT